MDSHTRDLVLFIVGTIVFTGAVVWGCLLLEDSRQRSACRKIQEHTGLETRYPDEFNMDEGCFVKTSGGWVPLANWRPND
jgi:hypothetical protein